MTIENSTVVPDVAAAVPVIGGGELLNMGVSMFVVLGAIVLLGWVYSRTRLVQSGDGDVIQLIASRTLGPKERLLLVQVSEQQVLVGMTTGCIQTLHVFEEPVKDLVQVDQPIGFAERLKGALQGVRK